MVQTLSRRNYKLERIAPDSSLFKRENLWENYPTDKYGST